MKKAGKECCKTPGKKGAMKKEMAMGKSPAKKKKC